MHLFRINAGNVIHHNLEYIYSYTEWILKEAVTGKVDMKYQLMYNYDDDLSTVRENIYRYTPAGSKNWIK